MSEATSSQDAVVIERTFDAPVDVVWQMWTDPNEFSAWYGPDGAAVHVVTWDLRVGGARLVRMSATTPSGVMEMWFAGTFLDVTENQSLVYTEFMSDENGEPATQPHAGEPNTHPATEIRVELVQVDGRTQMVMTHLGIPAGSPGAAGWTMAFAKLAARLQGRYPPRRG
jgi:uncharacterized protein YndB with AHSA1/START domain